MAAAYLDTDATSRNPIAPLRLRGQSQGLLEVADGGIVFLDEVGDLPLDAQVMLLRFLQNGEMRPVGSTDTGRVDVRLIAATHRDLEAAVERGTFREDFYYRLRRAVLEVPPLRTRRRVYGLSIDGVTCQALASLENHRWRENARELEAVLEQAMIFRVAGVLGPEDLDLPSLHGAIVSKSLRGSTTLTWCQEEALRIAAERHGVRRQDLMARCGVSRETARRELLSLVRAGELERVGRGRGARCVVASPAS